MNISIILAHPHLRTSRVNLRLWQALDQIADLDRVNLYDLYFNFHVDVKAEQKRLMNADVIVFQHPFFWYSVPPLLKLYMDEVLEKGFAYGPGGKALHGKKLWQVISCGGSEDVYSRKGSNQFTMPELLRPMEQTSRLCGMIPLTPLLIHDAGNISDFELELHAKKYVETLQNFKSQKWPPEINTIKQSEVIFE